MTDALFYDDLLDATAIQSLIETPSSGLAIILIDDVGFGHLRRALLVFADGDDDVAEIQRVAGAQFAAAVGKKPECDVIDAAVFGGGWRYMLLMEMTDASDSTVTPLVAGFQLGTYRIEAPIGEGGMGVVVRAHDTKLNRPVAIKFLSDELADAAARRRFQQEAQMASSLNHPHILTVYDVGEFEGRQYLVTEFVDGGTLKTWAKTRQMSWQDVAELLAGVADGLATAHQAGILHRDIKPDNILITASGYAKLADFGLAKLEEGVHPEDVTRTLTEGRTRPGMIAGTIAYMSPEQASGMPLDARSDIFSFGVVLYEMLAGRRPFAGATDLEVLQRVIHDSAAPLGDEIPEPLRALVAKALEKKPGDRYPSMRDLVVDLRRALRQGTQMSPAPPPRRSKWMPAAGIAAFVLAVAGGAILFRSRQVSGPPRLTSR